MTYKPPRKTKNYWLRMTKEEYGTLEKLAKNLKTEKSKVIIIALKSLAEELKLR